MFGSIPDESDRLKREATWLDTSLFKNLNILVRILFRLTALWLFREEMMLETSLQSVGEIKHESEENHYLLVGRSRKTVVIFLNLIEDRISSTIVEKCLLKALAIAIGYVKVALLLMIALGDAWFKFFSEIMLFILFHVFSRSLIFSWKNVYFG